MPNAEKNVTPAKRPQRAQSRLAGRLWRILAVFSLLATFLVAGCGHDEVAAGPAKPVVVCSIFAYYDAAKAIGGDMVDVHILLKPQTSPHEYMGVPSDKVLASKASLYIKNGMGLDDHLDKLFSESKAKILNISEAIPKDMILTTAEVPLDDPTTPDTLPAIGENGTAPATRVMALGIPLPNPHIWLDPMVQNEAAQKICDALSEIDPGDKANFQVNAHAYMAEVSRMNQEFMDQAKLFKTKDFIGFHSAYAYLAHRYGLRQIASVEELPGSGLSPAQLAKIIHLIEDDHIKYIAIESGLAPQGIAKIQEETGVHTITLQPLETYDSLNDSYVSLMRANMLALRTALGGP